MLNDLLLRLRSLFRRKDVESELDDELRFHFEMRVTKFIQSGLPPQEAKRLARLEFGGMEQLKEEHRDARGVTFIETLSATDFGCWRNPQDSPLSPCLLTRSASAQTPPSSVTSTLG